MAIEEEGTVTQWLSALRSGAREQVDEAARQLWQRYSAELVRLARARLRALSGGPGDEEDVALSAFGSFCLGAIAGHFPRLEGRDDLLRLLLTMTARKAADLWQHEHRRSRGGGRGREPADLETVIDPGPTPEFAALAADECRRLLNDLRDDTLRRVALLRVEGHSNHEIAAQLDVGLRTVERKVELIRRTWERDATP